MECLIFAKSIKDLVNSLTKYDALSETISDGHPKSAILPEVSNNTTNRKEYFSAMKR